MGSRIGYGRVLAWDQDRALQRDALEAAGCDEVFIDVASGKLAEQPELDRALRRVRPGDTLVFTRLSQAVRSLRDLIDLAGRLQERGVDLVVLEQGIDTTGPAGRMAFQVVGAIGEFQRELAVGATYQGLAAARARGRAGGRPRKLSAEQAALARQLYDERGPDGKQARTVAQIADRFGVTRATIYRHLDRPAAPAVAVRTQYEARPGAG
jgi:DNA invertase Pin-like site-specific DNA recombinase